MRRTGRAAGRVGARVTACGVGRAVARAVAVAALLGLCAGCVWLQNEFFVYDVPAPPPQQPPSGVELPW